MFRDLGATVEEITLPDMQAARAAGTVLLFSEAAAYHAADLRQRPRGVQRRSARLDSRWVGSTPPYSTSRPNACGGA